jgi:hypothetical protein
MTQHKEHNYEKNGHDRENVFQMMNFDLSENRLTDGLTFAYPIFFKEAEDRSSRASIMRR